MASTNNDDAVNNSSNSTTAFLSYFHEALKCLALSPVPNEDPIVSQFARELSAGSQTLIEEIVEDIRWFRAHNQSSALQIGDLQKDIGGISVPTNTTEAWHQSLAIKNIKDKIIKVSREYGEEGVERLSRLQDKIIKFHKETVLAQIEDINAKLITQDRRESKQVTKQVGYQNVDVPVGQPGDLVTLCFSVALAVVKPFAKRFAHKKVQRSEHKVGEIQAGRQVDRAKLKVLKNCEDDLGMTTLAVQDCSEAFDDVKDSMFDALATNAEQVSALEQPSPLYLYQLHAECGKTLSSHWAFDVLINEFLNLIECPNRGLVKSPATLLLEEFHHKTKDISKYVKSLLLAKQIIREELRDDFVKNITQIANEFAEILHKVNVVFNSWGRYAKQGTGEPIPSNMKKEAAAVTGSLVPFDREIRKCIGEITRTLEKKHIKSSSKLLQKLQKDGDRVLEGSQWEGRPLATTSEASDIVQQLEDIANTILRLSDEVMLPLTLSNGDGSGGSNPPTGSQREVSQAVSKDTLHMITSMLSVENPRLKDLVN